MHGIEHTPTHWCGLQDQLRPHIKAGAYIMLDAPGQSELYMCGDAMQSIVTSLTQRMHINLTVVQLVDSHLCSTAHKLLSALLMCLTSMLHLELPHINVLSKVCRHPVDA
jgi:GPN-loop GTPase